MGVSASMKPFSVGSMDLLVFGKRVSPCPTRTFEFHAAVSVVGCRVVTQFPALYGTLTLITVYTRVTTGYYSEPYESCPPSSFLCLKVRWNSIVPEILNKVRITFTCVASSVFQLFSAQTFWRRWRSL